MGQTAILTKIRENHEDLKGMIVKEVTKVRENVFLELAQVTRRLEAIESKPDFVLPREPFCPDNTVVIANLTAVGTNDNEVLLMEKINHLLTVGLGLPDIEPVAVTRKASRGRGPGLVLLELNDIEDKKTVLKAKTNLKTVPSITTFMYAQQKVIPIDWWDSISLRSWTTSTLHANSASRAVVVWYLVTTPIAHVQTTQMPLSNVPLLPTEGRGPSSPRVISKLQR